MNDPTPEPRHPAPPSPGVLRAAWLPVVTCAATAFLTFAVTLGGTYVYDDLSVVGDDPRVRDVALWPTFFRTAYVQGAVDNLYRPLTSLSFAVEWRLHDDRPWAFHLVNVLLHAGATAAVAAFAGRLWGRATAAWGAGLLFAVHPVHVEAVAGLVGRAESACALATFAGLALCLRRPMTAVRVAAVFGCFVAAVGFKEQGILFPLLAGLLFVATRRSQPAPVPGPAAFGTSENVRLKWLGVLLVWGAAAYLLYRESILKFGWDRSRLDWTAQPLIRSTGVDVWLMPLVLAGRYLVLLVWPARLSLDYGAHVIGWSVRYREPYVYLGAAAIGLWLAGLIIAARWRAWRVAFCLLGFALAYGMAGNFLVLIGTILGERLMYLPSAFLVVLAGAGLARLPARVAGPLVLTVALLGAVRSFAYARLWNDRLTLYERNVAAQPDSERAYALVYGEYANRGDWPAALRVARACQRHVPDSWEPYYLAGDAALHLGDLETARAMYREAVRYTRADTIIDLAVRIDEGAAATRPSAATNP